jgi:hypothetical protein
MILGTTWDCFKYFMCYNCPRTLKLRGKVMKKNFIKIGFLVTLLSVGVMSGCGPKECEHEGGTATCTELAICTKCGESYGELAAHNYGSDYMHDAEQHWKECVCGDKAESANHKFVAGEITKQPSCTEEGSQIYTCVCGETKTEILPVSEHEYSTTYSFDETEHWFECTCGDKKDVASHEFVAGEITKQPTCTEEGTQEYNCVCGATKTEILPVEQHNHSSSYTYNEEQHWNECTCGDKNNVENHEFVPGKVTKEPTCTEVGTQEYNCVCGAKKDVELATVNHKDDDLDIYCDYGCKKKIIPPYDTLLTCKTANALANAMISLSGNHYVQGEVVEVEDQRNGIFRIQDDSKETFRLRLVKGEGDIAYKDFECKIILGDYIKAYGKVTRDTMEPFTPQMQSPIVTYIKQHDHVYGEASCLEPATCECGKTDGEPLGHEDLDGNGLCDRCTFDLNNVVSKLNTFTKEGMTQVDDSTLSWSNDVVEFTITKGTSTQLYVAEQEHCRIYKGNVFAVQSKNNITIKTLKFFTSGSSYANAIITSLSGVDVTGVLEDTNVIVENFNSTSVTVPNIGSSIRITAIEIIYAKPAAEKEPTVVDFNTITVRPNTNSAGDGSYDYTYTTASGWTTKNAAIQAGGPSVSNPIFPVVGPDGTHKAVCLNGKKSAPGTLTSPTLTGGLEEINVDYTKMFTDTKLSVTITVTELSTGNVYTHTIANELDKNEKYVVHSDSWKLDTPVTGDYTIVFKNDCPSNSTSNKDRMTLLKVEYK